VEDGGVYSIKISNHAGTVTCSCKLYVREGEFEIFDKNIFFKFYSIRNE